MSYRFKQTIVLAPPAPQLPIVKEELFNSIEEVKKDIDYKFKGNPVAASMDWVNRKQTNKWCFSVRDRRGKIIYQLKQL